MLILILLTNYALHQRQEAFLQPAHALLWFCDLQQQVTSNGSLAASLLVENCVLSAGVVPLLCSSVWPQTTLSFPVSLLTNRGFLA